MRLDDMTQQNAALVEQATAASKAMAEQSQGLNDLMSRFDVGVAAPAAAAAQRAAPAVSKPKVRQAPQAAAKPAPQAAAAVRAKVAVGSDTAWEQF
jgi:methyl-accepting chemotaxis protein